MPTAADRKTMKILGAFQIALFIFFAIGYAQAAWWAPCICFGVAACMAYRVWVFIRLPLDGETDVTAEQINEYQNQLRKTSKQSSINGGLETGTFRAYNKVPE